ncbi:TPA: nuclease domain-containing protein [Stenotrophomonas maltophilia]
MNYRDRSLLDLAYQLNCTLQIEGVCEGGPGEPCHSNQSRHGKGGSIKAHDCFFASGCRSCHRALDQGSKLSREERKEIWDRAHIRTQVQLWEMGLIGVKA